MTFTDKATTAEKAKAWDFLMTQTGVNDSANLQEAWEYLRHLVVSRERKAATRQSEAMKRFLAIKFPTHCGTSPESEYAKVMPYPHGSESVDVTLTHGSTVIHCNDSNGIKTACEYMKGL